MHTEGSIFSNHRVRFALAILTVLLLFVAVTAVLAYMRRDPATNVATTNPLAVAASDRPGPDNTGDLSGVERKVHDGDLIITTAGTVIEHMEINGFVRVEAPNVVIRNSVIKGRNIEKGWALLRVDKEGASVTVTDTELYAAYPSPWIDGVRGANFTLERVNIHDVIDMVHIYGNNVTIKDSWLHDNVHYENDPAWNGNPSHDDSIQIQSGRNIHIRGNHISGAINAGIMLTQDRDMILNVAIDRNYLDGGGCTVNLATKRGLYEGVSVTNNVFGRTTKHPNCAIIAPSENHSRLTVYNNFYEDGEKVSIRKG